MLREPNFMPGWTEFFRKRSACSYWTNASIGTINAEMNLFLFQLRLWCYTGYAHRDDYVRMALLSTGHCSIRWRHLDTWSVSIDCDLGGDATQVPMVDHFAAWRRIRYGRRCSVKSLYYQSLHCIYSYALWIVAHHRFRRVNYRNGSDAMCNRPLPICRLGFCCCYWPPSSLSLQR